MAGSKILLYYKLAQLLKTSQTGIELVEWVMNQKAFESCLTRFSSVTVHATRTTTKSVYHTI